MLINVFGIWVNSNTVEIQPYYKEELTWDAKNGFPKECIGTKILQLSGTFQVSNHPDEVAKELNRQIASIGKE